MDAVLDIYASQPFWIWLAVGVLLLAVEAALSTEWLLWPAVAAGVVAVLTALGLRMGLAVEVGLFAGLTVLATALSRRLIEAVGLRPVDRTLGALFGALSGVATQHRHVPDQFQR